LFADIDKYNSRFT